ncbi:MAG: DNA-binding protein [Prevotellaceae bacterium]|jgi:hypothetical protein|nr:DNA-binding protein [Prevotellaceae bacterium]
MKKVKVIIERGDDGFSAYTIDKFEDFALFGFGDSVEKTIDDFNIAYGELKASLDNVPELQFDFRYDVASFLDYFSGMLSKSGLQKITGINQKQLWHYAAGRSKPRPETTRQIQTRLHNFADELKRIHFA